MPRARLVLLLPIVFAALLAACAAVPAGPGGPDPVASAAAPGLRYAFVLLAENGAPVARAITTAAGCPDLVADGRTIGMKVRAAPATLPLRPTANAPALSKPAAFPVLVCDAAIPAGTAAATIEGRALPLPVAAPRTIVVIGDSGCRIKRGDNVAQACNDPSAWPFAQVSAAAAATKPDLVVHVGDYHYRETACPEGNAGCAGSPWGYGWDAWEADFFAPAAPLLAAAPWVVVRGNHESCRRAGQGWWRLVDPRLLLPQRDCNDPADDAIGDVSPPYAVPIAANAQVVVFDSSQVGIPPMSAKDPLFVTYREQLEQAFALAAAKPQTLFALHHPVLAFAPHPTDPSRPYPGNAGMQSVLQTLEPRTLFPPTVQAVLSGHVHNFQLVSFSSGQPAQLVAGNGGDVVDVAFPNPFPAGVRVFADATVASQAATNRFGFTTLEPVGTAWSILARDAKGDVMSACLLAGRRTNCVPPLLQ